MSEAVEPRQSYAPAEPGLIDEVERRLMKLGGAHQEVGECLPEFGLRHIFTPGLYVRELTMPAGSVSTSKIHKTTHPFVVSQGVLEVFSEETGRVMLRAPHVGITTPGTRRLFVVHEDTVWTTFHPTDETDPVKIEREILEDYVNPLLSDQADYALFLLEAGFSAEEVRDLSEGTKDQEARLDRRLLVLPSKIEGRGVFGRSDVAAGDRFLARTDEGKRTWVGRYTNHAARPNCQMWASGDEIVLVALDAVAEGEELTVDYRQALALNRSVAREEKR